MKKDHMDLIYTHLLPYDFYRIEKLQEYIHLGIIKTYSKGSLVSSQEEHHEKAIYILNGKLRLYLLDNNTNCNGKQLYVYTYLEDTLFLTSLFNIKEYNDPNIGYCTNLVAIEDSEVCIFTKENLVEIFKQDEEIYFEILQSYLFKLRYYTNKSKDLICEKPSKRFFRFLYNLCLTKGIIVDGGYEVELDLSQQDLADIIGTHYVTINRLLNWLKEEKILSKTKNKIIFYDLNMLYSLIDKDVQYLKSYKRGGK